MQQRGFSLVELSIVLVILGLLTGGILAGQSLIRASELRSVSTEYSKYSTAMNTFRDKYFGLPGDFTKATSFWGDDNGACPDAAIPNGTPGTCNGNGDGQVTMSYTAASEKEAARAWQHLASAGLIEGSYPGVLVNGANNPGTTVPRSKIGGASGVGWWFDNVSRIDEAWFDLVTDQRSNVLALQYVMFSWPGTFGAGGAMKPEEAWNIDIKLDDGKPGQGSLFVYNNTYCVTAGTVATAEYKVTDQNNYCWLFFKLK